MPTTCISFFQILLNLDINELIYISVMTEASSWSIEYTVVYFHTEIEMTNFYRTYQNNLYL